MNARDAILEGLAERRNRQINEGNVVAIPHEFSSQDWNAKKVKERISIYLDYFQNAQKSGRKMKKSEVDDNFRKLEKICLGIKDKEDYTNANMLLNMADKNGFVYKKYVEKLVNDLSTGKKFNLKSMPNVVEGKENDFSGFKVRYVYSGDSISEYETTVIVKANSEKEAVKLAEKEIKKKYPDRNPMHFQVVKGKEGVISSYKEYKKKYPNSGFEVIESREEIHEGASYDFSKDSDRKKACDEYSKCMQNNLSSSSDRRMDELNKMAHSQGLKFVMTNYSQWALPHAVVKPKYEMVEESTSPVHKSKVLKSGTVKVKKAFTIKEFDEDDGWVTTKIKPGSYKYQVIDFRGWKPRQLFIGKEWIDVDGECEELEDLLNGENL